MKTARALIVWLLLPVAICGALVVSASATITLLTSQGVPPGVAPFGVLMLEVASLAGTLLWVLVGNRSLRRDARLVTVAATGVAVVAGLFAYGLVGAVGGVMLVAVVHLASRAWREPWTAPAGTGGELEVVDDDPAGSVFEPLSPTPPDDEPGEPPARVIDLVRQRASAVDDPNLERARELVARGAGRPTLRRELGVTDHQARKLLAEVKQA